MVDRSRRGILARAGALALAALVTWTAVLGWQIASFGENSAPGKADVAIVLGAAVWDDRPSPVFEQRIRYAVQLYRKGIVGKLIFTGGRSSEDRSSEAQVARRYALRHGADADDILIEARSKTTQQNLAEAKKLMNEAGARRAIIVSDPLHLKRAQKMATDLGISSAPGATPFTRYRSVRARGEFLLREIYFYTHYLVTGN